MLISWLVFPMLLAGLALGCGLLVERLAGLRLPGALLCPLGLAAIILVGQLATATGATAFLATPLVVVLAVSGLIVSAPWRDRRPDGWAVLAALGVFTAFAAPVVLSGEATFAGFIKLDDTASWLGITDRVFHDGYSHSGLAPSTYEAMLEFYLGSDYPIGSFVPLGVGGQLTGTDLAWLYQPYLALQAAMLALVIYSLGSKAIRARPLAAGVSIVASQPAILFGYALLGGVKELAAAWLVALAAALVPHLRSPATLRATVPVAITIAATVGALGFGGLVWLVPALVAAVGVMTFHRKLDESLWRLGALAALAILLAIPSFRGLDFFGAPAASTLTDASRLANLFHPLSVLQVFGIWPVGDFRLTPAELDATHVLIAIATVAGLAGTYFAWTRRSWATLLYLLGAGFGAIVIVVAGSPWVGAKALAIASPALLFMSMLGVVSIYKRGWVIESLALAVLIVGGVVWSNVLASHAVNLAPRKQLAELEHVGERITGEGPTLMTEYQPFGARYFLRKGDPESASEYRRRRVPLQNGALLEKNRSADVDRFSLEAILPYRTLVLRRSPVASRPPSPYKLVMRGRYYDVWQRSTADSQRVVRHLSLGDDLHPGGVAKCEQIKALASSAGKQGHLIAARSAVPTVVSLDRVSHPTSWADDPDGFGSLRPTGDGDVRASVRLPTTAAYRIWVGGSFGGRVTVRVDGKTVGSIRNRLNNQGQYELVGQALLERGRNDVVLSYSEDGLRPGAAARPVVLGPLVFASPHADRGLQVVNPAQWRTLCGRRFDWIEAVQP